MTHPSRWIRQVTYEDYQATKYFSGLDGLRAVSVIAVIWQHTSGNPGPAIFSKGGMGVQFFFAISGFLITTLLLREKRRTGRISLKGFYIRRTLRIMPLYYLILLTYIALVFTTRLHTPEGQEFLHNVPAFATYTSNWFVDLSSGNSVTFYFAWSLATEEQYYLVWPLLLVALFAVVAATGRGGFMLPIGLLLVLTTIAQSAEAGAFAGLIGVILASMALPILLGSLAAIVLDNRAAFENIAPVLAAPWFAPLIFTALLAALVWNPPAQVPQILMVLAVISVTVTEHTVLHPVLRWRVLVHIGVVSYGIYLMHMLCANTVRLFLPQDFSVVLFGLTTLLVIAVASVSYRIIEAPLVQLGRRLSGRRPHDPKLVG